MGNITQAAFNPAIAGQLGVNPVLTELVLGMPTDVTKVARGRILRNIMVPSLSFSYKTLGKERLRRYDTVRAMRAPIGRSEFTWSTDTATLKRYSHAGQWDIDELSNSESGMKMQARTAYHAKTIVDKSIEQECADLIFTSTNYPSTHRFAISSGSEWDSANGDSLSDIDAAVEVIEDDTGLVREQLSVFLGFAAARAALKDPILTSRRLYSAGDKKPTLSVLADYWGVKEVFTANPVTAELDGTLTRMYGDSALVYYDGGPMLADFESQEMVGELVFAVNWVWNKGSALQPWYDRDKTSWVFPWQDYATPKIINNYCASLITNCEG